MTCSVYFTFTVCSTCEITSLAEQHDHTLEVSLLSFLALRTSTNASQAGIDLPRHHPIPPRTHATMKTVFASFLMLAIASANIIFPFIQPICDFLRGPNSCLSGQVCVENNTCVPSELIGLRKEIGVVPRPDGRCGHDFGGASCDPNGPYGGCCSKYGWCGKTPEHCLVSDGCQAGCSMIATPAGGSSTMPSSASTAALSEPVISPVTTSASAPGASGSAVTTDGTCGAAHGGIVCGDWYLGSCCSM